MVCVLSISEVYSDPRGSGFSILAVGVVSMREVGGGFG